MFIGAMRVWVHGPGSRLVAVSEVSLGALDVVGDSRSDAGNQRVDSKHWHDDQRHCDDQCQPEECRRAERADSASVLRV